MGNVPYVKTSGSILLSVNPFSINVDVYIIHNASNIALGTAELSVSFVVNL